MRRTVFTLSTFALLIILLSAPSLIRGTGKKSIKPDLVTSATSDDFSGTVNAASEANILYDSLELLEKGLNKQILDYALKGYNHLLLKGLIYRQDILSICDFSQSSRNKRFYIIDINKKQLLLNTYVAHGKNSGSEYARSFSNTPSSLKSSLGFYVTRNTYIGGHGLSLKIQGMEKGFNDQADRRNIVVHGSDYVGADFLRFNHFSGRSYGCPALPADQTSLAINTIKDGTCLFIYHPTQKYLKHSRILNS